MAGLKALAAIAVLASAAGLCGCNLVVTERPMFSAADAHGAPKMRPGLWAAPDPACEFTEAAAADQWPDCAHPSVLSATEVHSPKEPASKGAPYLIVAGDPLVLQARADTKGDIEIKKGKGTGEIYFYLGLKPVALDKEGRVTAAEAWFIQCGPPPEKPPEPKPGAKPNPRQYATRHPLPGLKINDAGMCEPADGAAILRAAGPSSAWSVPHLTTHWVRDGEH